LGQKIQSQTARREKKIHKTPLHEKTAFKMLVKVTPTELFKDLGSTQFSLLPKLLQKRSKRLKNKNPHSVNINP